MKASGRTVPGNVWDSTETRVAGMEGGRGQEETRRRGDGGQVGRPCRPERALPFSARCEQLQGFMQRGEVRGPWFYLQRISR